MSASDEFMDALGHGLPENERVILCGFVGDPDKVGLDAWRPRPWRPEIRVPFNDRCNVYTTISSFTRANDGSWRRRQDYFAAGRALMIDDVGTKVDAKIIERCPPSAVVETSPGNFQAWYFLSKPVRDRGRFDGLIRAFIKQQLLGADPGMAGVNRVGRVPDFINGKAKYGGAWRVRLELLVGRRYTDEELIKAFGLTINGTTENQFSKLRPDTEEITSRAKMFADYLGWLQKNNMIKKMETDPSGWIQIRCPWVDNHTGRADTGAAIRKPANDNGWYGAFRCHHGHCANKDWMSLTDHISEEAIAQLDNIAAAA